MPCCKQDDYRKEAPECGTPEGRLMGTGMAKKMMGQERPMLSRRAWIGRLATLAGLVLLTKRGAAATTTQTTKAAAHYQDSPNAGEMCGM